MTIAEKKITYFNEEFTLTNQCVIYWEKESALILSDLHIGKSATFRKSGIPISKQVLEQDLFRLETLINHYKVTVLIVVGDLFHAEFNQDIQFFIDWFFEKENLKIELILGNHDKLSEKIYEKLCLTVYKEKITQNNIRFVHDNVKIKETEFIISGHTHPGVLLKGKAKQRIKLPCFQVTENQLILPAFSNFTGFNTQLKPKNCISYAFTDEMIFEI